MSGIVGGAGSKSGIIGETELEYEEGTWTPTNGNALQSASGTYIRIGNIVHCSFYLLANASNATTGDMAGLPFTSNSEVAGTAGGNAGAGVNSYTNVGAVYFIKVNVSNTTFRWINTYEHKQISANKNAMATFTYHIA